MRAVQSTEQASGADQGIATQCNRLLAAIEEVLAEPKPLHEPNCPAHLSDVQVFDGREPEEASAKAAKAAEKKRRKDERRAKRAAKAAAQEVRSRSDLNQRAILLTGHRAGAQAAADGGRGGRRRCG